MFLRALPLTGIVVLIAATEAAAYIGPGMGVSAAVAVLGVLFALFLLAVAVVWYPLKHLWNSLRRRTQSS